MKVWKRFRSFFSKYLQSFMVKAVQSNRKIAQSSVSVSTYNQSVARLDDARPRSVAIFWHCTKRGAWTVESTGGADRRAVASCRQTFKKVRRIRDFIKKKNPKNTPFRRPSCQAREEKRKFSPTATSLRRRRQRSRTWATAQRALAEERKWRPKVHQARRDDRFSSRFLSLLLTAAIVPTRPTPLLLCSPLPLSLSDQVWCIQRCDCVNCT